MTSVDADRYCEKRPMAMRNKVTKGKLNCPNGLSTHQVCHVQFKVMTCMFCSVIHIESVKAKTHQNEEQKYIFILDRKVSNIAFKTTPRANYQLNTPPNYTVYSLASRRSLSILETVSN